MMKKVGWYILVFLCFGIAVYALAFPLSGTRFPLVNTKPEWLPAYQLWNVSFNAHVIFGALALLTGWSQFSTKIRLKRPHVHRKLGLAYVIFVSISGLAGLFIGYYATGGPVAQVGFIGLGITWTLTTWIAFAAALRGRYLAHERWMTFSFAACLAAVTLRIYLPILSGLLGFITAYRIIAWACWVPNILVAWWITRPKKKLQEVSR